MNILPVAHVTRHATLDLGVDTCREVAFGSIRREREREWKYTPLVFVRSVDGRLCAPARFSRQISADFQVTRDSEVLGMSRATMRENRIGRRVRAGHLTIVADDHDARILIQTRASNVRYRDYMLTRVSISLKRASFLSLALSLSFPLSRDHRNRPAAVLLETFDILIPANRPSVLSLSFSLARQERRHEQTGNPSPLYIEYRH